MNSGRDLSMSESLPPIQVVPKSETTKERLRTILRYTQLHTSVSAAATDVDNYGDDDDDPWDLSFDMIILSKLLG